jgi:hypothetical protein
MNSVSPRCDEFIPLAVGLIPVAAGLSRSNPKGTLALETSRFAVDNRSNPESEQANIGLTLDPSTERSHHRHPPD